MKNKKSVRTPVEKLLMEILFQVIPCESSNDYIISRLRKAGFSEDEIRETQNG